MTSRGISWGAWILSCASVFSCGEAEVERGLSEWQGSGHHLSIRGRLDGETLDVDFSEAERESVWCSRLYEVPEVGGQLDYSRGKLVEVKVEALMSSTKGARRVELEFKQHDFRLDPAMNLVRVVPRVETQVPAAQEMWLEWEWHSDPAVESKIFERAAMSGDFQLAEFSGAPGADGLIIPEGEGRFGGFVRASWTSAEELSISFTVDCRKNEVESVR